MAEKNFALRFPGQGLEVLSWEGVREGEKRGCLPCSPFILDGIGTSYRALGHSGKRNRPLWFFIYWVVFILFHSVQCLGYRKVLHSRNIFPQMFIFVACLSRRLNTHVHIQTHAQTHLTACRWNLVKQPFSRLFKSMLQSHSVFWVTSKPVSEHHI